MDRYNKYVKTKLTKNTLPGMVKIHMVTGGSKNKKQLTTTKSTSKRYKTLEDLLNEF